MSALACSLIRMLIMGMRISEAEFRSQNSGVRVEHHTG
jgi:hypothetical protein